MASLVLGAVGSYLGGPIGYMIGSALGAALFPPPGQDGPRLSDLKVQNSVYGNSIPIIYGTFRAAGNVIWAAQLVEHAHETDSGSGGGGITTYTYTCSFAVSLCEGPIAGVRRVWADGKLIYDITPGVTSNVLFTATSHKLYLGTESQTPDPTIEAGEGIGNVPAYRGQAYWVFTDLELGKFGNRLPNLTFEVIASGGKTDTIITHPDALNIDAMVFVKEANEIWLTREYDIVDPTRVITRYDANTLDEKGFVSLPSFEGLFTPLVYDSFDHAVWAYETTYLYTGEITRIYKFDINTQALLFSALQPAAGNMQINPVDGSLWAAYGDSFYQIDKTNGASLASYAYTGKYIFYWVYDSTGNIWFTTAANHITYPNEDKSLKKFDTTTGAFTVKWVHTADIDLLAYDSTRNSVWLHPSGTSFYRYDIATNTVPGMVTWVGNYAWQVSYEAERDVLWVSDIDAGKLVGINLSDGSPYKSFPLHNIALNIPYFAGGAIFTLDDQNDPFYNLHPTRINLDQLTASPVMLSSIVSDVSSRAGLSGARIDVNPLVDLVDGFCIATPMSAQAAIEPLSHAYFFDSVDSEGRVRFVKRGATPVTTVAATESLLENK